MNTDNLFDRLVEVYWDTYLRYLDGKKKDEVWVKQNMEWLKKTSDIGLQVIKGIEGIRYLLQYFHTVEKNPELTKVLFLACRGVLAEYEKEYLSAA